MPRSQQRTQDESSNGHHTAVAEVLIDIDVKNTRAHTRGRSSTYIRVNANGRVAEDGLRSGRGHRQVFPVFAPGHHVPSRRKQEACETRKIKGMDFTGT